MTHCKQKGDSEVRSENLAQKILEHLLAVFCECGLRVKLHSLNRKFSVTHSHDLPFSGFGGDFEAVGHRITQNDKGMIAGRVKG